MSRILDATITCPNCGRPYEVKLFRTLWGDGGTADDNALTDDKVNIVKCPHCEYSFRAPLAFMYVDCKKDFAVWWEPSYDAGIDEDAAGYAAMFGPDSYYAQAPRIQDWDEFKATVRKYYTGELRANPISKFDIEALKSATQRKKNGGCLGVAALALITASVSCFLLFLH